MPKLLGTRLLGRTHVSGRPLYLELASLGVNPATGDVLDFALTCGEIAALMRHVRENRAGLREVLVRGRARDLEAIKEEG